MTAQLGPLPEARIYSMLNVCKLLNLTPCMPFLFHSEIIGKAVKAIGVSTGKKFGI